MGLLWLVPLVWLVLLLLFGRLVLFVLVLLLLSLMVPLFWLVLSRPPLLVLLVLLVRVMRLIGLVFLLFSDRLKKRRRRGESRAGRRRRRQENKTGRTENIILFDFVPVDARHSSGGIPIGFRPFLGALRLRSKLQAGGGRRLGVACWDRRVAEGGERREESVQGCQNVFGLLGVLGIGGLGVELAAAACRRPGGRLQVVEATTQRKVRHELLVIKQGEVVVVGLVGVPEQLWFGGGGGSEDGRAGGDGEVGGVGGGGGGNGGGSRSSTLLEKGRQALDGFVAFGHRLGGRRGRHLAPEVRSKGIYRHLLLENSSQVDFFDLFLLSSKQTSE